MMTSRERVLAAIAHKEPDRTPIDFGSMRSTGIMAVAYHHLREYMGVAGETIRIYDVGQQLAEPEAEILERFQVDVLDVVRTRQPAHPDGGEWQPFDLVDLLQLPHEHIPAEVPASFKFQPDGEGGLAMMNEDGQIQAKKPKDSFYFDPVLHPLAEAETTSDIERLWPAHSPSQEELDKLRDRAKYLRENTDKALLLGFGGNILEAGQGLRGWEQFMIDLAMGESFTEYLLDKMAEQSVENLTRVLDTVGPYIDVIQMGDDLGTQAAPQVSPATYNEKLFPRHKKIYQVVHAHPTDVHVFLHSCGCIRPYIPKLIEAGVEILNPVQTSATGMDPSELKNEFGKDLTFWGGGCETQSTLPNGTPEQVTEEVKRRMEIFAPGGGFVFNQIHNIQAGIPPENVCAMFAAAGGM